MVDYQNTAQGLATLGRGGDSTLVHMQPEEVEGLQQLALANGTSLTVNPNTGMPEAFNLRGLLPMVAGVGLAAAGMDPMMAGLMLGGATAVLENDLGAGLGAGLGAYGGASLGKSLDLLGAETVPIGSTTGEIVTDQIQQNLSNMNPTIAGPSGPGMTGFSSTAGGGTMGIPNAANAVGVNPAYPQGPEFQGTNVGSIPRNVTPNLAGTNPAYPQGPGFQSPPANKPTMYRNYTQSGGVTGSPPVNNLPVAANPAYPQGPGFQATADTATKFKMPGSGVPGEAVYGQVSEDGLTGLANRAGNRVSNMGRGIDTLVNDYDRAREILGTQSEQVPVFNPDGSVQSYTMSKAVPLDNIDMAMKFGLPIAGGVMAGLEPEDFEQQSIDMTQFEDTRFRGPDGQLNLSGQTGLNLNNPYGYTAGGYGYAEGGAVEQGMEAAIARNIGKTYTPPTPVSAPVSAPVAPSNINVGGFRSAPSNLTGGMGSLNVGTGTIGKSPNAVAAKAIEDAKPKTRTMQGMYGMQMTVPIDYDPGTKSVFGSRKPSHYQLKDGTWVKGTPPPSINLFNSDQTNAYGYVNKFAKGGAVEQGMEAAIARNMGRTYTPTAPVSAPVSAPVAPSNINVGGFRRAPSNFGGLGALNVRTGTVGQSPNAVAEAARLKAIEDAKPKYTTPASGTNVGGGAPSGGNSGFSVPTKFVVGMGTVPADYTSGLLNPYYRDIAGNFIRKAQGGIIPAAYAEGGAVEQGMEAAIARNSGRGSSMAPAPIAGPADSISNFNNLGSLNVNSGTIGQSPNAVAAAARLKAIEDAKPKPKPVYQGFSVTQQQGPTLGDILGTTGPGPRNYAPTPYDIIFGGQQGFAEGGYLGGGDINVQGDGMSDDIPANIDNEQPAALSEGEFVIPADVVSHIGNGSSEAGAKEFYGMMDRVRMARTGRKKQSPEIDPERFMPA